MGSENKIDSSAILLNFKRHISVKIRHHMRKSGITIILLYCIAIVAAAQQSYEKLPENEISQTELRQAISLGEKLLLGQKAGDIYILSEDEAIPEVARGLTEGVQQSSYENIRSMFGEYESMQFAEAWKLEADQSYTIYRFKGTFDAASDKPEIRMVMDQEGKLAGFWIRPWEDDMGGQP